MFFPEKSWKPRLWKSARATPAPRWWRCLRHRLRASRPPCPHFGVCGGCHYQHSDYTAQLEDKRQILQETILRGAKLALPHIEVHSGEPYGFRNRTRMKIAVEPEFALGYYRHGSHDLEPVRNCPISSPLINQAIALLWELAPEAASYPSLREVQFFANHNDSELLVELFIHHATTPVLLAKFAKLMRERMPQIAGVAVFASGATDGDLEDGNIESSRRLSRAGVPYIEGSASLIYNVGSHGYRVSAGSFFQTNRFLAAKLVELVTANRERPRRARPVRRSGTVYPPHVAPFRAHHFH